VDFFNAFDHIINPPLPPCTVFADFWYLGFYRQGAEILKSRWGLGTEEEEGYRTGPPGYIGWRNSCLGIDSGNHSGCPVVGIEIHPHRRRKPNGLFQGQQKKPKKR
jgi:hypothetical protein